MNTALSAKPTRSAWPAIVCWLAVMLEGFDLVVLGAVIPVLLKTEYLGFTPGDATLATTLGLIGVGVGAACVGPVSERLGRRYTVMLCVLVFSVFTILVPFAPSVFLFAVFRLIAGLGLGAVMPSSITYMTEYFGQQSGGKATTLTMTGYHVGAVLTSLFAAAVVPHWQEIFWVGGAVGIVLLPFLWFKLPESDAFAQRQQEEAAGQAAKPKVADVFKHGFAIATIGTWVASFMGLLLVYGLNTWLPKIMVDAGYPETSAILQLFILNVGAVVGLILAGWLADKHGTKSVVLVWFGLAAILLALLSIKISNVVLLDIVIFCTGVFVFSAQGLIYAFCSTVFAPEIAGTALGLASGIGRVGAIVGPYVTGMLVTVGLVYPWGFYVFALVAVLGFVFMAIIPRHVGSKQRADAAVPTS